METFNQYWNIRGRLECAQLTTEEIAERAWQAAIKAIEKEKSDKMRKSKRRVLCDDDDDYHG